MLTLLSIIPAGSALYMIQTVSVGTIASIPIAGRFLILSGISTSCLPTPD